MVKMFNSAANPADVLAEVVRTGIAGMHGGRVEVRQKRRLVAEQAAQQEHLSIRADQTFNHPHTELAYPFDEERFTKAEAQKAVVAAYDEQIGKFLDWVAPQL